MLEVQQMKEILKYREADRKMRMRSPRFAVEHPPLLWSGRGRRTYIRDMYKLYYSLDASPCFSITSAACQGVLAATCCEILPDDVRPLDKRDREKRDKRTKIRKKERDRRRSDRVSPSRPSTYTENFVSTGRPRSHNVACKRAMGERDRQDLITFCRPAGWKLAQLHDADVVPCYHVNGRLNVLGRDKRVCGPAIYVATTSSVLSIRPVKAGRILSLDVVG